MSTNVYVVEREEELAVAPHERVAFFFDGKRYRRDTFTQQLTRL